MKIHSKGWKRERKNIVFRAENMSQTCQLFEKDTFFILGVSSLINLPYTLGVPQYRSDKEVILKFQFKKEKFT